MILVLLVICILLFFAAIIFVDVEWVNIVAIIPFMGAFACIILAAMLAFNIVDGRSLQAKIDMYEEENQKIETDISTLKYSELIINQEIRIYVQNNTKIKELKEKQIDINTYKWWLYFGGGKE